LPAIVTSPSTKSVGSTGIGSGSQRSWFGGVGGTSAESPNSATSRCRPVNGSNGRCTAAGRIRYSHARRLWPRGAVNAVPDSCSAYSPYGARCGELRPCGSAPGSASVANSFPKPLR
jgi:hypothetical protein